MLNGSAVSFGGHGRERLGFSGLCRLHELPQLLLQKLDPRLAWASLLSAHKYDPKERVHLMGVLAGMCGVTMAD